MSLATRIVVANVFLLTLFSYPNRQFFMPSRQLREVESKLLRFLTPIAWAKLGLFTAVDRLYGLRIRVTDLRLSNVASVLSTCERWRDMQAQLAFWQEGGDAPRSWQIQRSVGKFPLTSSDARPGKPLRRC